jgi:spermidine/putrescine transport system permease protein
MTVPRDEAWVEAEGPGAQSAPGPGRRRFSGAGVTAGILSVPMLWLILFFVIPVILVAMYSVGLLTLTSHDVYLSLDRWRYFLHGSVYVGTPLSRGLFWRSVKMSLGVSVTCVILSYTLLLVIIAPFLTSYLLRVLAWRVLLNPQGIVQSFLRNANVLGDNDRIAWMFPSMFAVYLVLAYVWVPFVALPIFVSLESLDMHLLEASSDLGASRWTTFRRVTLPLSMPGVIAAFVFVFIPTLGEYITPQIVGGPGGQMFGNAIQGFFSQSFDWQLGSAMAMFLIFAVAILLAIFGRYLNVRTVNVE